MKKNSRKNISRYPFIIHADPLKESTAYPTHTHGLADVGMPEFLMDPLAFGGDGNAGRINAAYDFFRKKENEDKFKAILNGEVVKVAGRQLCPKPNNTDPYVYCFREVTPEFEAVKEAYGAGIADYFPRMQFVQIWVDGDDYALTDEYYRGGVKPR